MLKIDDDKKEEKEEEKEEKEEEEDKGRSYWHQNHKSKSSTV